MKSITMKKIARLVMLFGTAIIMISAVQAQEKKIWTLEECLDQALQNNISIQQQRLSNDLLDVSLDQTKATRYPSLSGSASQGWSFGRSLDTYTNEYVTDNVASTSFSLSSSVTLFDGFQVKNSIKQQEVELKAGQMDLEQQEKDISISVSEAYLQVLFAEEQLENALVSLESSLADANRTKSLVESGSSPIGDLLQLQAEVASSRSSCVSARNDLAIAKVNLMQILEIPYDSTFSIEKPALSEIDPDKAMMVTRDQVLEKALQTQPSVESSALAVESAKIDLDIAKGARYPSVSLSGSVSTGYSDARSLYDYSTEAVTSQIGYLASDPTELVYADSYSTTSTAIPYAFGRQLKDNISESVRLSLSIPIYSQKQVRSGISKSKISIETARLSQQSTLNSVRKLVEQAYLDWLGAGEELKASREEFSSVEKSFLDVQRKFELGLINATEYLTQQNDYNTSKSSLTKAKYNYVFLGMILDYYLGEPMSFEKY